MTAKSEAQVGLTAEQRAYVDGLRELADLFERIPDLISSLPQSFFSGVWGWDSNNETPLARMTRLVCEAGGRWEKQVAENGDLHMERHFGPHTLTIFTARENVCEKVVTTETVTREIPDPDAPPVPTITVTEEVETVEWICPESLLDEREEAVR